MDRDEYIRRAVVAREGAVTLKASGEHDAVVERHGSISLAKKFVRSLCFARKSGKNGTGKISKGAGAPIAVSLAFKGCINQLRARLVREEEGK
jgi:hypothetical protein